MSFEDARRGVRAGDGAAVASLIARDPGLVSEMGDDGSNLRNPYRGTPLLWAVYSDRAAAAVWLLDHGADPNVAHDFGGAGHGPAATALHLAAQFGAVRCLDLLLEHGADTSIRDGAHDATRAEWALEAGQTALAERLRSSTG